MIQAGRKQRLIAQPRKCPDQREQVSSVHVGSRHTLGLSADQELRTGRAHCDARGMKRGIFVRDCGNH
jgi:hypothetical protein